MRALILFAILGSLAVLMTTNVFRQSRDAEDGPVSVVPAPADGPEAAEWAACESQFRIVRERSSNKREIAFAVIRGEVGLLDAAACFRDLTDCDPLAVANLRYSFAGRTDNERCARAVISYVQVALRADRSHMAVADRLAEELERLLVNGAFESD